MHHVATISPFFLIGSNTMAATLEWIPLVLNEVQARKLYITLSIQLLDSCVQKFQKRKHSQMIVSQLKFTLVFCSISYIFCLLLWHRTASFISPFLHNCLWYVFIVAFPSTFLCNTEINRHFVLFASLKISNKAGKLSSTNYCPTIVPNIPHQRLCYAELKFSNIWRTTETLSTATVGCIKTLNGLHAF